MVNVALCAILRDEARYLREWLAFHTLQGVSRFRLYDNGSADDTAAIARRARDCEIAVIDWAPSGHFDAVQRRAYLDGARALEGRADFVAFLDADEFLFDPSGTGLPEALAGFGADVGAIAVNQRIFGSSGLTRYRREYVTTRFVRAAAADHPERRWFKTVARPQCVEGFDSVHSVTLRAGRYVLTDGAAFSAAGDHPGCAARIAAPGRLALHHYIVKSKQEFEAKRRKWSDTKIAGRHDVAFFASRDVNETEVAPLAAFRAALDRQIDRMWPQGRWGRRLGRFAARTAAFVRAGS